MEPDQELELLRARVAHLESLVEKLTGAPTGTRRDAPSVPAGLDRRRMLRNGLGLSAAAVAGVGMLDAVTSSAAAADGDSLQVAATVSPTDATSPSTRILNPSSGVHAVALFQVDNSTGNLQSQADGSKAAILATFSGGDDDGNVDGAAVRGLSEGYTGVHGYSQGGSGVHGQSDAADGVTGTSAFGVGVHATSSSGTAIQATATDGDGIVVTSESGYAVKATTQHDDASVFGIAPNGIGVLGTSDVGWGVAGQGKTGVRGDGVDVGIDASSSAGTAVKATTTAGTGLTATATSGLGVSATSSAGTAVEAMSTTGTALHATSTSGTGVSAVSATGVGARFEGGAAAIRLVPRTTTGRPTTGHHLKGELSVDSAGALWLCTKSGTPGRWKQLAFA